MNYPGAADHHVDDALRLPHPVEGSGHKGVVLHGVGKDHQLGAAQAVPVRGFLRRLFDDFPHEGNGVHVDARPGGGNVHAGADQLRLREGPGDGLNEPPVPLGAALVDQGAVAADEVHAAGLGRPVQGQRQGQTVPVLAALRHQGHGGHGDALVYNGNAVFPFDGAAGFHQFFRPPTDFVVHPPGAFPGGGVGAVPEGDAHGDGADVQVLVVDHVQGL